MGWHPSITDIVAGAFRFRRATLSKEAIGINSLTCYAGQCTLEGHYMAKGGRDD